MSDKLRIALLGGGKMAMQHARAIRRCESAELTAVVDPAVAEKDLKGNFGAAVACFGDAATMLEQIKPDVVHVVTPPDSHAELARACLDAGAHVYVEKPFALTLEAAELVLQLATKKKLRVCAAHQVLFQDAGQRYGRWLPMIGKLIHVESLFSFKPVRRRAGGGGLSTPVDQLIDILPHAVYLLLNALPNRDENVAELDSVAVLADGEVRALVRSGDTLATLVVSLRARPVESYLRVMGANGSVTVDFILGYVVRLPGPGASGPSVVVKPFREAWQQVWGSLKGLLNLFFSRNKSYPGLAKLLDLFYSSIRTGSPGPISAAEIRDTVRICEAIGSRLRTAERDAEARAEAELRAQEKRLQLPSKPRGVVLLTGGTGLLGRRTAESLRDDGWCVRVAVRRSVSYSERLPGVHYVLCDLSDTISLETLTGVDIVIHAAAETIGDLADHERNTVRAMRNLLDSMNRAGIRRLVHVSSVAVLKPAAFGKPLTEDSPVDLDNLARGPYVWAKAEAERLASEASCDGRVDVRIVRLGPLVDDEAFTPPGRLGRELVRLFIAIGGRSKPMSICSVATAARVLSFCARSFDVVPRTVNLLEVPRPTRGDLANRLRSVRPDLKVIWMPFPILRMVSVAATVMQKLLSPRRPALNLYAAFKSEVYDETVARQIIEMSGTTQAWRSEIV